MLTIIENLNKRNTLTFHSRLVSFDIINIFLVLIISLGYVLIAILIALQYCDARALDYTPSNIFWKRFRNDIFIVWSHSIDKLDIFFDYMNKVDATKTIQSTMEVATGTLEFLHFKLKFDK